MKQNWNQPKPSEAKTKQGKSGIVKSGSMTFYSCPPVSSVQESNMHM